MTKLEREERAREKAVQEEAAMRCIEISQTARHTNRRDCCALVAIKCAAACRKPIKAKWYVVVLGKKSGMPMYFIENADTSKGDARVHFGADHATVYGDRMSVMNAAFLVAVKHPIYLGRVAALRKTRFGEVVMTPDFREI